MVSGSAFMPTVGGGWMIVTVTLSVAVPPGPVAVIEYVVVSAGDTWVDPLTSTMPISGSIMQVSALVEVQVSVEDSPR